MTTTLVLGLIAPAICFFICALAHFHALHNKTPAADILFFQSNNERGGICMVLNTASTILNAFVCTRIPNWAYEALNLCYVGQIVVMCITFLKIENLCFQFWQISRIV